MLRFSGVLLFQVLGFVFFQSFFFTVALDLFKKGKGKLSSIFLVDVKFKDEVIFYKYKCKYCSKVFGIDSFLQIYFRFYIGERFFVCFVCGYRFIIKGNFKVYFYRYFQVKVNFQLFVEFYDKMAVGNGFFYVFFVFVFVDESSFFLDSKFVLVIGIFNVGLFQNFFSGINFKDFMGGLLFNDLQFGFFSESEDGFIFFGVGLNYNFLRVGGF